MKIQKKVYTVVMMILFLLPFVSFAFASDKEEARYGGLNDNDIYVYLTTFNKKPLEKFYEKFFRYSGFDEETSDLGAEEVAKGFFDDSDYDKDIEAIKYYILKVETDKEQVDDIEELHDYYGRKVWYNKYISEDRDANEWELTSHENHLYIMGYQKKLYKDFVDYTSGFFKPFIAKGVSWNHLASKLDDEFDDLKVYDIYLDIYLDTNAGVKKLNDGIQTYCKIKFGSSSIETEKFRSTSRYTSKGVLYYYEWTYNNKIIAKFELEQSFYSEFWVLLLIISVIAGAIFIIILRHELKQ